MTGLVSGLCAQMGTYWDPKQPGQEGGGERWAQWDRTEADHLPREPGSCGPPGVANRAGSTVGVREAGQWNRAWSVIPRPTPLRKSPAGTVGAGAESLHPLPRIWLCKEQLRARLCAARAALKPGGTGARAPWRRCGDLGHHYSLVWTGKEQRGPVHPGGMKRECAGERLGLGPDGGGESLVPSLALLTSNPIRANIFLWWTHSMCS